MKKALKISLLATGALVAIGAVAASWLVLRPTPEKTLYKALANDTVYGHIIHGEVLDYDEGSASLDALIKKDGTYKMNGEFKCRAKSAEAGDIEMQATMRQVQEKIFSRIDKVSFSNSPDKELTDQAVAYINENLTGKWLLEDDNESQALAFKKYGIVFDSANAISNKLSGEEIGKKLKENKVITILDTKNTVTDGIPVVEYTLQTRRSAYEAFIKSVQPGFKYTDDILDGQFEGDTSETTVAVNKKTGAWAYAIDSVPNLCGAFIAGVDPTAAEDLPQRMKVKTTYKQGEELPDVTLPADYLTPEELNKLLYEE
jgi:hypothetical protein